MVTLSPTAIACLSCLAAFGIGTVIRFGDLMKLLDAVGILPESWQHWLFPANHSKQPN